jgi:lysozyme family protein
VTIDFDTAFTRLLGHEGGYTNNPVDPGGETNWGICKRSYPLLDIKNLTRDQAACIYYRDFWQPLADAHPAIRFQVFDFAVNSGIQTAIRKLQQVVKVADDGHWGPVSAASLAAMDVNDVLMLFVAIRIRYWASLSTWSTFGKGWAIRAASDLEYAALDN